MNRQAVIGIVFVIILIIIGWQVYGLFGGGSSSSPTIQPVTPSGQMSSAAPGGPAKPAAPAITTTTTTTSSPAPALALPNTQAVQIQPASVMPNDLLRQQQQSQNKYISMINDLQLLRVQRDIAETNQAIAAAELAKVTAEKTISDTLTRPTQAAAAFPTIPGTNQPNLQMLPPQQAPEIAYTIVSVSMQGQRWTALLDYQGKLFSVTIGDVLPMDNSKVVSIGRNGVVLRRDGKNRRISIVSSSI